MKRLWCRFVLIGLAVSLLLSSIAFSLSLSQSMTVSQSVPGAMASIQFDLQGWIFHCNRQATTFDTRFYTLAPNDPDHPWERTLEDLSPTWIGSGVVYASWGPQGREFTLIGVKHYVIIPGLAIATLLYALWFRRRWQDDDAAA